MNEDKVIQTDNSVRPEDGTQDVSQDPNVVYDAFGNVIEEADDGDA